MGEPLLLDRTIVAVSGAEAEPFLNRLLTNNVPESYGYEKARYAGLLSPQGKLLFDFFVVRQHETLWIDCARDQAEDLVRKLAMFRLRAKVTITIESDLAVAATWGGVLMEAPGPAFRDPRHDGLGYRIIAPLQKLKGFEGDIDGYEAHRIALGVPRGGVDFTYGDSFVHDANLDLLHGVDFEKGCYVGQEVVSRVHHRKSARKRVVGLRFLGDPPQAGTALAAGALRIGEVTSLSGQLGLATARIDRLDEAAASHVPVLAGETLVEVTLPTASVSRPTPDFFDEDD